MTERTFVIVLWHIVFFYALRNLTESHANGIEKRKNYFFLILLFEQQQLVTTSRLNNISESNNLYVVCEWKRREWKKISIEFGRFLCKWSFRIFEYHTCIYIHSNRYNIGIHAYMRKCAPNQAHTHTNTWECVKQYDFWPQ